RARSPDGEITCRRSKNNTVNFKVYLRGSAVGNGTATDFWKDLLNVLVVHAQHCRAIKRNLVDEIRERSLDLLEGSVVIQMLTINVSDNRDDGCQLQKRAITLVIFHDENGALADASIRVRHSGHAPANHSGVVHVVRVQNTDEH